MTAKTPIRAVFNESDVATGLAEFQSGEFIGVAFGGTGAATHTSNSILLGNGTSAIQSSGIQISGSTISSSDSTLITIADGLTVTGNLTVTGTTTTVNSSTIQVTNSFTFEGSTSDDYETTLTVTDPTADRTITLPNATGIVSLLDNTETLTNKTLTSPVLNGTLSGSAFLDEDDLSSDSATAVASQQSIKAYVDSQVTAQDLDFQGDS